MKTEKKPYTPPTITDHGDAVEETKGFCGKMWEYVGNTPFIENND